MPGYEDRASILQGAGDMIFKLVCERSTPEQWAEWLRAPLEHAAGTANHDLVEKLLKAGADCSAGWKGCHGKTLLHAAAEGGDGEVVTALIRAGAGADKNAKTPNTGHTPLHVAILSGKEAAAGALIMAGADVNILDAKKDAPLHLAIIGGHAGVAKDLLIGGANHAARSFKGQYPIHLAAARGLDEIVRSLVQRGANLDLLESQSNKTPLAVAVLSDHVSTVEVLLAGGADVNIKMGSILSTTLHIAEEFNKPASIPAIIEAGADIDAKTTTGTTPLYCAARFGSCAAVLALLQRGANVNSKNNNGWTSLHSACYSGNADTADLLLLWGADETIVDNAGKTPSQYIPDIEGASEQRRPTLERLTKLLAHAAQDRAWRRRGFVVMCRAYHDSLRLVVEIADKASEAIGQQPEERPSRRARHGQVKIEVGMGVAHGGGSGGGNVKVEAGVGDAHGGGSGSDNVKIEVGVGSVHGGGAESGNLLRPGRWPGVYGTGGRFDGVAAWLMTVTDKKVFRKIVSFL